MSLNDCLQTGPNLIPKLFDVVARFRSQLIVVAVDIEKAFQMIGIASLIEICCASFGSMTPNMKTVRLHSLDLPVWFLVCDHPLPF